MLIKPLAKLVFTSGWYWVPAFFWIIACIYGAGFTAKGIGGAVLMSVLWFFAIYATFGTAIANEIDRRDGN